jgi:hypothetical protein
MRIFRGIVNQFRSAIVIFFFDKCDSDLIYANNQNLIITDRKRRDLIITVGFVGVLLVCRGCMG